MTAIILLALGLGGLAAGILIGRYYVPDDRELRRTARHARAYVKTINLLLNRDRDAAVDELIAVVAENVDDVEPYFALGALFRNRGEWERAIRVHQAIELREHHNRKQCLRARYQLGLDFRAAGMPRRATRAMEDCLTEDPKLVGALRALGGLYEEQGRFSEAASAWHRIAKIAGAGDPQREHHLLCAAAQRAVENADLDSAKQLLRDAERIDDSSPHLLVASAELAAAKGKWQRARDRLEQALAVRPDLVSYLEGSLRAAELELRTDDSQERSDVESLVAVNPQLLPARVASARLALASGNSERIHEELEALVANEGMLESALGGFWVCSQCEHRAEFFFWRCESCRQWGSVQQGSWAARPKVAGAPRERRSEVRALPALGDALPEPGLESGLTDSAARQAAQRPTALGRAGRWLSGALGRE